MEERRPLPLGRPALMAIALVAATFAVYAPTFLGDFTFINSDDTDYVTQNPHVQSGVNLDSLAWAFNVGYSFNWHPLTWISLEVDSIIWPLSSRGFHFTNVLLHAANAVLLFLLLRRMTKNNWPSAAVAALFALHPAHVESVAWVAERKDVLSGLFWLLTTLAYVHYAERPVWARYVPVPLLLALGLMAKPMLVTLPATLLLLDYWPLRRPLRWRLIVEKLPLLVIVAATIPLTLKAQERARIPEEMLPLPLRWGNALVSYVKYIGMLFWPENLGLFYPHPKSGLPTWQPIAAGLLLLTITALAAWQWRRRPYLIVGWMWYVGTLIPVVGLVQVGMHARADRYTYIPYIGLGIMLAWGIADLTAGWVARIRPLAVAALVVFGVLAVLAYRQVGYWRDSETIWSHTIAVTGDNPLAHDFLANTLVEQGRMDEALPHLRDTVRMGSASTWTYGNLGAALASTGNLDEAARQYELMLRMAAAATQADTTVDRAKAHRALAQICIKKERLDAAATHYLEAEQLRPNDPAAFIELGDLYEGQGRLEEARLQFAKAAEITPNSPETHLGLAGVLRRMARPADALQHCDAVLNANPENAAANDLKGVLLAALNRLPEAIASHRRAVKIEPRNWEYHVNLAYALAEAGENGAAEYRAASRLEPKWTQLALEEAWTRATHPEARHRDGALALRAARQVCQATEFRQPQPLDVLAAAYAELKQFDDAIKWERRAFELLLAGSAEAKEVAERLRLYQAHQPYRQPAAK
jgi:tetratricopeptide (TPR) repeat protein